LSHQHAQSPALSPPVLERTARWAAGLRRLDPASVIMAVAAMVLCFLVLYPLFWLFYGSFAYGDQPLSGTFLSRFWQLPGLGRAFRNTLELLLGAVPLSFLLALPLVWISAPTRR
jgi:ABC-type Fe3+ transport system permease subunit